MELETSIVIMISVTIISLVASKAAVKWRQTALLEPKIVEKRLRMQDDLIEEYKDELKRWKSKFSQSKQLPKIEVSEMPADDEALRMLIKENLPGIANMLPAGIGKLLLGNEDKVFEFVKANPAILERFVGKKSPEGEPETGIPEFSAKNAV